MTGSSPSRLDAPDLPAQAVSRIAQKVLATLADTSAATLFAFAEGLTNEPASHFSLAINYLAGNREPGEQPDRLTEATMRSALRNSVTWKDDEFIDQLGDARRPSGSRRGRRS